MNRSLLWILSGDAIEGLNLLLERWSNLVVPRNLARTALQPPGCLASSTTIVTSFNVDLPSQFAI